MEHVLSEKSLVQGASLPLRNLVGALQTGHELCCHEHQFWLKPHGSGLTRTYKNSPSISPGTAFSADICEVQRSACCTELVPCKSHLGLAPSEESLCFYKA